MSKLEEIRERVAGYTKGPWQRLNSKDVFTVSDERRPSNGGFQIADCAMDYALPDEEEMSYEEQMANARLIAAAPDLLALCEEQNRELREAVELLRKWNGGPMKYDRHGLHTSTDAFLARHKENT